MSFSEFTYPLLQAWDWWHMYHSKKIQVQIGGADQFGNIIAGLDAVNYIRTHHPDPTLALNHGTLDVDNKPFGFTVPLLTTSSGDKFGKSAGNAIWLDKELTSVFDLYGFFLRQSDADAERFLKLFTFLPIPEIEAIVKEHMDMPSKRLAQHKLAFEVVTLVHGRIAAVEAESQHKVFFSSLKSIGDAGKTPGQLASEKNTWVKKDLNSIKPGLQLPMSLIQKGSIGKILRAAGLVKSNSEGHQLAAAGGAYIGGRMAVEGGVTEMGDEVRWRPIQVWKVADTQKYLIEGQTLLLRKGKVNIKIIEIVSDEKWKNLGLRYPGEGGSNIEEVGPIPKTKNQIEKVMGTLKESNETTEKEQEDIVDVGGKVESEGKKKSEETASKPVSSPDT
jgi:tyrosyl-tRNA synthetase